MVPAALDENVAAIVLVESRSDGSLAIKARPVEVGDRFIAGSTTVALSIWRENPDVIRMSLKHDASGLTVYLQGGAPLVEFASKLGLRLTRTTT